MVYFCVGIDPGTVNCGWACVRVEDGVAYYHSSGVCKPTNKRVVRRAVITRVRATLPEWKYCVIERQFFRREMNVEDAWFYMMHSSVCLQPRTVKKLCGVVCTGNHTKNKKAAVDRIRALVADLPGTITDHEADALLCAVCWSIRKKDVAVLYLSFSCAISASHKSLSLSAFSSHPRRYHDLAANHPPTMPVPTNT